MAIICWQDPTPLGPVCNNLTVHYYTAKMILSPPSQPFTDNLPLSERNDLMVLHNISLLFLADEANIYISIVNLLIGTLFVCLGTIRYCPPKRYNIADQG